MTIFSTASGQAVGDAYGDWEGKPDKAELFSPNPGSGD